MVLKTKLFQCLIISCFYGNFTLWIIHLISIQIWSKCTAIIPLRNEWVFFTQIIKEKVAGKGKYFLILVPGLSYKHFTSINYNPRVVIWAVVIYHRKVLYKIDHFSNLSNWSYLVWSKISLIFRSEKVFWRRSRFIGTTTASTRRPRSTWSTRSCPEIRGSIR